MRGKQSSSIAPSSSRDAMIGPIVCPSFVSHTADDYGGDGGGDSLRTMPVRICDYCELPMHSGTYAFRATAYTVHRLCQKCEARYYDESMRPIEKVRPSKAQMDTIHAFGQAWIDELLGDYMGCSKKACTKSAETDTIESMADPCPSAVPIVSCLPMARADTKKGMKHSYGGKAMLRARRRGRRRRRWLRRSPSIVAKTGNRPLYSSFYPPGY